MAGYEKMLEREGLEAAETWLQITGKGIRNNYQEMDRIVQMAYDSYPDQIATKPKRSNKGYDANYTPEQQGLPSLFDELRRNELITPEMYAVLKSRHIV